MIAKIAKPPYIDPLPYLLPFKNNGNERGVKRVLFARWKSKVTFKFFDSYDWDKSMIYRKKSTLRLTCVALFSFLGIVCTNQYAFSTQLTQNKTRWSKVNSWLYQLQNINLEKAGASKFDLIVMDYSRHGDENSRYTRSEISDLKNSSGGKKIILAYMSIGEAEDYRWYWKMRWDKNKDGKPDKEAPAWLGQSNPNWVGNYKVKFWDKKWQKIIFGTPDSYLDKIIDTGFDGVYLDIVDAYFYWGPWGESGLKRKSTEREMVDFVKALAHYARKVKGVKDFGVFPQNGEYLIHYSDYTKAITGLGKESTWFNGDKTQVKEWTEHAVKYMDKLVKSNKLVLAIDYVRKNKNIDTFYKRARAKGYIPYSSVKELNKQIVNEGYEPE